MAIKTAQASSQINILAAKAPDPLLYLSVVQLRRRSWTRSQIDDLPPDLAIETDPNDLLKVRRFWLKSRIEALERDPDWIGHRARVDQRVARHRGRDLAETRAGKQPGETTKPQ
jgi:hypothetical protein